ncbi:WXG100 family type VII secretion target [Nocardia sp. NBC_00881]|uniref:WXG100 family type VII secretion target n=1 Tax=Nocardia sp. NBC_00881 TaxID=2975995 RepID=UPI0038671CCF|nr:WXG100 family type VII secretion target [Nocardia sp. NBC_00881]
MVEADPGAGKVHLSEQEAADVVNELINSVDAVRRTIDNIGQDIEAAKGGWQGDASGACQAAAEAWGAEAFALNKKLNQLMETVSEGNQTLTSVDASNVDSFTNLV